MAVVYRHRRLDNDEVFYVGMSKSDKRPYDNWGRSGWWKKVANKYGHYVEIISRDLDREDACELEELLIQEYGRKDLGTGCLVNMTNGGTNFVGKRNITKGKVVLRFSMDGKFLDRFESSCHAGRELGINHCGIRLSCKENNKSHFGGFLWKFEKEGMSPPIYIDTNTNKVKVSCYSLSGNIIKSFCSLKEAERETGISSPNIHKSCNGHTSSAGGYLWEYGEKEKIKKRKTTKSPVFQLDLEGNRINAFESILEASSSTGVGNRNISNVCAGISSTAGGFIWKYKNK